MIYIGKNEKFFSTLSLSLGPEFTGIYTFDPEGGKPLERYPPAQLKRSLMQRYAQIEKVKSEQTQVVGILIGSVVVDNYLALINRIKVTAAKAGKKYYEVLIGKLNEPKLKNFQFVRLLYLDPFVYR